MSSAPKPELMSPAERIADISKIPAAGLMRLRAPKSSPKSGPHGDSFVDFSASKSGHSGAQTMPEARRPAPAAAGHPGMTESMRGPPNEILDLGRALGRLMARIDFDAELEADQGGR